MIALSLNKLPIVMPFLTIAWSHAQHVTHLCRSIQLQNRQRCRREILRICELMKLRIFDTETNRIQSQIYYDPANVCITPENIEINISEIDL